MHNPLERHLLNRFSDNQHGRSRAGARMRDLARSLLVPVGLLWFAVPNAGCNEFFGITPTTLAPPDAYTCGCTCNGGGQSFDLSTNVCLAEDLNAAINPSFPPTSSRRRPMCRPTAIHASSRTSSRWRASASRTASAARARPRRI